MVRLLGNQCVKIKFYIIYIIKMIEKMENDRLWCGAWLKNFSYAIALVLALLSPQELVAWETCGWYQWANVMEVIVPSWDVDTVNVINFNSAREEFGRDLYGTKSDILKDKSEYTDSLANKEIQDYIMKILEENEEIQSVISDMRNDETVNMAINSWDKYFIIEKFLDKMDHGLEYWFLGCFYTFLTWLATVLGWKWLKYLFKSVFKSDKIVK